MATTLTEPDSETVLVVATVRVELATVAPVAVTAGAEQLTAVNGETWVQLKVMFDPLVPSTLRAKVVEPLEGIVTLVAKGVTEKSLTPAMAFIKVPTSGEPNPVTWSYPTVAL